MVFQLRSVALILPLLWLAGCGTTYEPPESATDCARQFLSAIYNGNFKRARQLSLEAGPSRGLLADRIEKDFRSRTSNDKEALSKSSIVILEVAARGSDSAYIRFLNAYDQRPAQLLVLREDGEWRVDLSASEIGNKNQP